jgi:hypothetical protein
MERLKKLEIVVLLEKAIYSKKDQAAFSLDL